MATTAAYTTKIRPAGGYGSATAGHMTVLPVVASTTIDDGDILIIDGTAQDMLTDNSPAVGAIFGVAQVNAANGITGRSTIDRDGPNVPLPNSEVVDTINVAVAHPGARFSGCMIGSGINDLTSVYQTHVRSTWDCGEATNGMGCLINTTSAPVAFTLEYETPQVDLEGAVGAQGEVRFGREAGAGLTNARFVFMFLNSATVFS